jgi:hypothetical protein
VHHPPRKPARYLLGLAAAVTALGLAVSPGLPALARPVTAAAPTAAGATAAARQLLLINGDRLAVTSAGGRQAFAVRAASPRDAVTGLSLGGLRMEIPTIALPYLGRGLSASLFEVSALQKAESGGRLPVRIAFAGRRPVIPGVTVTGVSGGAESGYLTAASARAFGAALLRQYIADHASGRYGSDGLFGHGVSIGLPGASGPARTRPAFKMHTLTITGRNLQGRPDTGDDVLIGSADNPARFGGLAETDNFFFHGTAKFSVPAGHYWAMATFLNFTRTGGSLRLVVLPQFTVTGRHTTVRVAERSASSKVTFAIPRKAQAAQEGFELVRGARTGGAFSDSQSWSGLTGWVSPTTRKPTVGTLNAYTSATFVSPAKVSPGYAYNLDFPGPPGLVPRQAFRARPADLGAVTERYYQDVPTRNAGWIVFGGTPQQLAFEFEPVLQVSMPSRQVQYFSAGRNLLWTLQTLTNLDSFAFGATDDLRTFAGGQRSAQDWNRYPLHPAPNTVASSAAAVFPTQASAARHDNTLYLISTPFTDNQFGHLGPGFFGNGNARVLGSYSVRANGRLIARGNAVKGIPGIRLGSAPATVGLTLSATRLGGGYRLSGSSTTTWTWRSARDTTARLPAAWYCTIRETKTRFILVRQCAAQPMMTLSYQVQGLSLTGMTRPGRQVVEVTAGHIQPSRAARITGATASVSFNDGDSFAPAAVTAQGGGRFRVSYSAPPGVDVTIRLHATDAAGGSITETIVRGYGVGS